MSVFILHVKSTTRQIYSGAKFNGVRGYYAGVNLDYLIFTPHAKPNQAFKRLKCV